MSTLHKNIQEADLHEPKGVSLANAGMVYRADGAGSGEWKYPPLGWGYYQDSSSAQSFSTTPTKVSINGGGALTNENFLPREIRGTGHLWDTINDKITMVRQGDSYDVRVDLPITSDSAASELTVTLDIGGASTVTFPILYRYQALAKTPPYTISMGFPLLALSPTTIANGIQMFISTDSGSVGITNPSITLIKNVDGDW